MKISKQRLKEIIKEEIAALPTWEAEPFGEYDVDTEDLQAVLERAPLGALLQASIPHIGRNEEASVRQITSVIAANLGKEDLADFLKDIEMAINPPGNWAGVTSAEPCASAG